MSDAEVISRVLGLLDPGAGAMHGLRRGGDLLLALPADREAAARALRLYQPQRPLARGMVAAVRGLLRIGLHGRVLREVRVTREKAAAVTPLLPGIGCGTCGVLLGSPEHRVRRAIASYRNAGVWEVAKISFGAEGAGILEQEARALTELQLLADGVPPLLGLHHAAEVTVLRMPYLSGKPVPPGDYPAALLLLDSWVTDRPPQPITAYQEWPAIVASLAHSAAGRAVVDRLSMETLRPVICHGDFARWNLLRTTGGELRVLDWEWGHQDGLPGIDLVHYFLQDARMVARLAPASAIAATQRELKRPECAAYLAATGWTGEPLLPILACLAYKQGARHQDNTEVLAAAVMMTGVSVFR